MYVCICNAITESQIRTAAEEGTRDLWSLQSELGVAAGCGTCRETASAILSEYRTTARRQGAGDRPSPVRYIPATG